MDRINLFGVPDTDDPLTWEKQKERAEQTLKAFKPRINPLKIDKLL